MNSKTQEHKDSSKPAIFRFESELLSDSKTNSVLLEIPQAISKKLKGLTKVEGTINGRPFRTILEPNPSGGYWLRVSQAMSRNADATVGDTVQLAILTPEPEIVPADLKEPLNASPEAEALWQDLTPLSRLDWIRWINLAKSPETRARRITRTIEQLSEGKRRACCVNVNEYMLCHIEEDELRALNEGR